jgi:hypothetical protein
VFDAARAPSVRTATLRRERVTAQSAALTCYSRARRSWRARDLDYDPVVRWWARTAALLSGRWTRT